MLVFFGTTIFCIPLLLLSYFSSSVSCIDRMGWQRSVGANRAWKKLWKFRICGRFCCPSQCWTLPSGLSRSLPMLTVFTCFVVHKMRYFLSCSFFKKGKECLIHGIVLEVVVLMVILVRILWIESEWIERQKSHVLHDSSSSKTKEENMLYSQVNLLCLLLS